MYLYNTVASSSALLGVKEQTERRIKKSIIQTSQTKDQLEGHLLFESTVDIVLVRHQNFDFLIAVLLIYPL